MDLDIEAAYRFYKDYLLDTAENKTAIYTQYGFKPPTVESRDWEVFAAILLKDKAGRGVGADLERHEVKSATFGNSFEYQYHRDHGVEKLTDERSVDHLFISHKSGYRDVEVRFVKGSLLVELFNAWLPQLIENYDRSSAQRFRRSIAFGHVKKHGQLILKIEGGQLVDLSETTDSGHSQLSRL